MNVFSQVIIFYIFVLMAFPPHAMDHCDHDHEVELTSEKHQSHEHPEDNCCPPFSVCKHCSIFIQVTIRTKWASDVIQDRLENNPIIPLFQPFETIDFFWHPPRLA